MRPHCLRPDAFVEELNGKRETPLAEPSLFRDPFVNLLKVCLKYLWGNVCREGFGDLSVCFLTVFRTQCVGITVPDLVSLKSMCLESKNTWRRDDCSCNMTISSTSTMDASHAPPARRPWPRLDLLFRQCARKVYTIRTLHLAGANVGQAQTAVVSIRYVCISQSSIAYKCCMLVRLENCMK